MKGATDRAGFESREHNGPIPIAASAEPGADRFAAGFETEAQLARGADADLRSDFTDRMKIQLVSALQ